MRVGKSKTKKGAGRVIPMSSRFGSYWSSGRSDSRTANSTIMCFHGSGTGAAVEMMNLALRALSPTTLNPHSRSATGRKPGRAAKIRAGVTCRFHDLRHTGCTRMLEKGVPLSVVADIMGWSASTMAKMAERYGHIGNQARRAAIDALSSATTWDSEGHKYGHNQKATRRERSGKSKKRMAPQVGLEPTTLRLTAGCSAIELLRSDYALEYARCCCHLL